MFEIEALSFGCFLRYQLALQDNNLEPVGQQYRSGGRLLQGFFHIVEHGEIVQQILQSYLQEYLPYLLLLGRDHQLQLG